MAQNTAEAVVFLTRFPVVARHREAWGFDHLAASGLEVIVLDLHPILAPWMSDSSTAQDLGVTKVIRIRDLGEFDTVVARLADRAVFMDYVVGLADADWAGLRILRTLQRHLATTYEMAAGDVPLPSQVQGESERRSLLWNRLARVLDPRQLFGYLERKAILLAIRLTGDAPLPSRIFGTRSPTVLRYLRRMSFPESQFVPVNAPDYDRLREWTHDHVQVEADNTCVFIDMAMTSHPDMKTLNLPTVDSAPYLDVMTRLFDEIEKDTGLDVVIAEHPWATYPEGAFGGRPLMRGRTMELVSHARCVITHASTAVAFAVLFRKPIVLVLTDGMIRAGYQLDVVAMANALGVKVFNADEWTSHKAIDDYMHIPEDAYRSYEETYLWSAESRDRASWDIVAEHARADLTEKRSTS